MKLENDPRYTNLLDGYMREVKMNRDLKHELEKAHQEKIEMIEEIDALEAQLAALTNAVENAIREERVVN